MEIFTGSNSNSVAAWGGQRLSSFLLQKADRPTLLLLSGGSSLSVLENVDRNILRSNISFGLIDERFGVGERDLNAESVKRTSYMRWSQERGVPFTSIEVAGMRDSHESAERYESYLKQWRTIFPNGLIAAVLGVGEDGHTAGILPYPEDPEWFRQRFEDTRSWVVGYDTKNKGVYPERVTVSLHFLIQEVDFALAYACGKEKREALERATAVDGTTAETPARVLIGMREAYLCTDAL